MALPFEHPPLMPDEPLQGFVARIAHHYGTDLVEYCNVVGIRIIDLTAGRDRATDRIAEMTGIDAPTLAHQAFSRVNKLCVTYRDQILDRNALRRRELWGCPACLREDMNGSAISPATATYVRGHWFVRAVRTCPRHRSGLVPFPADRPFFGRRGYYDGPSRLEPVLERLDSMVASAVPRDASCFETYVLARLEDGTSGTSLPDAMPLHAAIRTCEVVGAVTLHGAKVMTRGLDEDDWRVAGAAGFDVVAAGPDAVRSLLSTLQRDHRHGRSRNGKARDVFGCLYAWLRNSAKGSDYAPIRNLVREHILDTVPLDAGVDLFGVPVDRRRVHSVSTACHNGRQISHRLSRELRATGVLREGLEGERHQAVGASVETVDAMIASLRSGLSKSQSAMRLCLDTHQFQRLIDAGLVTPIVPKQRSQRTRSLFSTDELDGFMRRIEEVAPVSPDASGQATTISNISHLSGVGMTDILEHLFAGRLPGATRRPDAIGYPSILVDVERVGSVLRNARNANMRFSAVARILQVNVNTPAALVQEGHLKVVTVVGRRTHGRSRFVTRESVEAFSARMVSLVEVSRSYDLHNVKMMKVLEKHGVRPIIPNGRVLANFYRRDEVEGAMQRDH